MSAFATTAVAPPCLDGTQVAFRGCCPDATPPKKPEPVPEKMTSRMKFVSVRAHDEGCREHYGYTTACKLKLEESGAFLGAGAARERLKGLPDGQGLGPGAIGLYEELGLRHPALADWRSEYWRYGSLTEYGYILLAGTLENFKAWAKSEVCLEEAAGVPDGRLFAYIEHGEDDADPGRGYITSLAAGGATASPTVSHGVGYALWHDGDWYHGSFRDGRQHGQGTRGYSDGGLYDGEWAEGKKHGRGRHDYPDGGSYDGEWAEGSKHGRGMFGFPDGGSYDGEWAASRRHGRGTYSFPDGTSYDGEWMEDQRHGRGTFGFPDGGSYDGQWAEDRRHGRGTCRLASGRVERCVYDRGELQSAKADYGVRTNCVLS